MQYRDKSIGPQSLLILQVFPVSLLQLYNIKHLTMQSSFTNICERMSCSKEFKRGTVTGYHCTTVATWKCLGTTATQPQVVHHIELPSAKHAPGIKVTNARLTQQLQSFKPPVILTSAQHLCDRSFMASFQWLSCSQWCNVWVGRYFCPYCVNFTNQKQMCDEK